MLFVFGGVSVDIARVESQRVEMQNVLDSAIFAASVNNDPNWSDEMIMDDFFEKSGIVRNKNDNADWGLGATQGDGQNGHAGWAHRDSPNLFLNLFGFTSFTIEARSEVEQQYTDMEISLVIDLSGSMAGTKMIDLRTAVEDFATTMFDVTSVKTHISIIPFDLHTNAGRNLLTAFHSVEDQAIDGYKTDGTRVHSVDHIFNMPGHCFHVNRGDFNETTFEVTNSDYNVAALSQELQSAAYSPGLDDEGKPILVPNTSNETLANTEKSIDLATNVNVLSAGMWRDVWSKHRTREVYGDTAFNWWSQTFANSTVGQGWYAPQNTELGQGYEDGGCRRTVVDSANPNGNGTSSILPFATDVDTIKTYMAGLQPNGATASDIGIKWGMALLDPSMRNTITAMIDGVASEEGTGYLVQPGSIDASLEGRPVKYDDEKTLKIIVHMSDGVNSAYQELLGDFLNANALDTRPVYPAAGPRPDQPSYLEGTNISNVFYDEATKTYSVLYTDGFGRPRYYCANGRYHYTGPAWYYRCDFQTASVNPLGVNPQELTKREVLDRFTIPDAHAFFFSGGPYSDINIDISTMASSHEKDRANANFLAMCDIAENRNKEGSANLQVFTIAFDLSDDANGQLAKQTLSDCVKNHPTRAHVSEKGELGDVFDDIAGTLTKLRLVN